MPGRTLATDAQVPRIRLGKHTQNVQNIGLPAEIFQCAGKTMHAKGPCSLPGKAWQDLNIRYRGFTGLGGKPSVRLVNEGPGMGLPPKSDSFPFAFFWSLIIYRKLNIRWSHFDHMTSPDIFLLDLITYLLYLIVSQSYCIWDAQSPWIMHSWYNKWSGQVQNDTNSLLYLWNQNWRCNYPNRMRWQHDSQSIMTEQTPINEQIKILGLSIWVLYDGITFHDTW